MTSLRLEHDFYHVLKLEVGPMLHRTLLRWQGEEMVLTR